MLLLLLLKEIDNEAYSEKQLVFFVLLLNKLYEAIIKRKLWHSVGIIKFTAPKSVGHFTFLYRINTFGVANRLLLKKVQNVKSWYCKNNLQKILQLLTIFAKCSIIDVWQGSEYASVSDFEYTRVLNTLGLYRILNMPQYARIIFEHSWICLNMPKYVWVCLNLSEWFLFCFLIVILCLLERVVTYFNLYRKLEVIVWMNTRQFSWRDKIAFFL